MKKVEQAVKEADYKQLMEKVLDSLQEKKGAILQKYILHTQRNKK